MQGYGCGWPVEGFGGMCGGRRLADSSAIADRSLVRCGQMRIRRRTLPAACQRYRLRPGDDFIGTGRQSERDPAFLICPEGGAQIQLGEFDLLGPRSGGPVVAARVDHSRDDGVIIGLFVMSVAEDENSRREFCSRCCTIAACANTLCLGISDVIRLSGPRCNRRRFRTPHVAVSLPLDHEGGSRFWFFLNFGNALCGRRWCLHHDHGGRAVRCWIGIQPEWRSHQKAPGPAHVRRRADTWRCRYAHLRVPRLRPPESQQQDCEHRRTWGASHDEISSQAVAVT